MRHSAHVPLPPDACNSQQRAHIAAFALRPHSATATASLNVWQEQLFTNAPRCLAGSLDRSQVAPPILVKAADDLRLRRLAGYVVHSAHLALVLAICPPFTSMPGWLSCGAWADSHCEAAPSWSALMIPVAVVLQQDKMLAALLHEARFLILRQRGHCHRSWQGSGSSSGACLRRSNAAGCSTDVSPPHLMLSLPEGLADRQCAEAWPQADLAPPTSAVLNAAT